MKLLDGKWKSKVRDAQQESISARSSAVLLIEIQEADTKWFTQRELPSIIGTDWSYSEPREVVDRDEARVILKLTVARTTP